MDCCGDHAVIIVVYFRTLPFPSLSPCLLVLGTPWFPSSAYSLGVSPNSITVASVQCWLPQTLLLCLVLTGLCLCAEDTTCPWPLRVQAVKVSEPRAGGRGSSCSHAPSDPFTPASVQPPPLSLPFALYFQGWAVAEHFPIP